MPDCTNRLVRLSFDEARAIEGYAEALQDIMYALTGENGCSKSYDPMTIYEDGVTMHSYAFDMKDGGRHHSVCDYESVREIRQCLLREAVSWINSDSETNAKHTHR
jgi:hypothetical protein